MNKYIDHTLLKADATYGKVETLCTKAKEYDFASVCVSSYWVSACAELLKGTDVKVYTVVGLPLGTMNTKAKAFETAAAIVDGAKEIGMILNIGEMKTGRYDTVRVDIKAVTEATGGSYAKVILENCLLTKEKIVRACELCVEAGATFVKTSTGLSTDRTTPENIKLMKDTVKGCCLVRTAGGVRCYEDTGKTVETGADRIGTGAGMELIQKEASDGGY